MRTKMTLLGLTLAAAVLATASPVQATEAVQFLDQNTDGVLTDMAVASFDFAVEVQAKLNQTQETVGPVDPVIVKLGSIQPTLLLSRTSQVDSTSRGERPVVLRSSGSPELTGYSPLDTKMGGDKQLKDYSSGGAPLFV